MIERLLDSAMDWAVLPGYTSLGYRARERLLPRGRIELAGHSVMLTGASAGIGEAACVAMARAGARVHMVVRDPVRGEDARARVAEASGSDALEVWLCDVSSLASVRELAAAFSERGEGLDVLVNNAGLLPAERTHTAEGFELAFATNVLGPFLLTSLMLAELRRAAPSRVINVSSGGMYTARIDLDDLQLESHPFDGARFYAHTKRAEVMLSEEWAARLAPEGIAVHSTHPGWVATPGVESSLPRFNRVMGPLLRTPEQGADTIVWLAGSEQGAGSGGEFWHDRRARPKHRVPWTRESAGERRRLFEECERLCGLGRGEAGGPPVSQPEADAPPTGQKGA
ncbi:MAG: SDR family NAD(P)-dependent oxidoreductase [Solirubrobacterales bacterium]